TIADQSNINNGTLQIGAGAAAQSLTVGLDAADPVTPNNTVPGNGTLAVTGGTTTVDGVLGAGNDGTITGGTGSGHVTVSSGTLSAQTVILGSAAGGTGDMTVSGTGQVVVGGGLSSNGLTV